MTKLPLSAKVALWSFLLAVITLGTALLITSGVLERELVAGVDVKLERNLKDICTELDRRSLDPTATITKETMPRSIGTLHTEIFGPGGAVLYRSAGLKQFTLQGGGDTPRTMMVGKSSTRVATAQHRGMTVLTGYPLKGTDQAMERVRTASVVAFPVAALLSLIGGYWVASRAMRPVRKITEAAARITAENSHQRLPLPAARDEIRLLTSVLNDTFDRLDRSYQQAVRFASDASHQLKTPVTVMRAAIEALLTDASMRPDQNAVLNDLLDQTRRLSSLTEGLLLLARADAGGIVAQPAEADLIPIIERCIEDAEVLGTNQQIRIERDLPANLFALADPQRTEQILLNLLENAVKYNKQGGVIRVRAGERRDGVFITVANTGQPIPRERMPWIFDRFARGDRNEGRAGHGLGLSIARELASAQGGDVRLLQSDENMTEFELRLVPPGGKTSDNPLIPLLTPPLTHMALKRIPG